MDQLNDLPPEDLVRLLELYAPDWLAHGGCRFPAAEETFGMQTAIEPGICSRAKFTSSDTGRVMKAFGVRKDGGLDALEKCLSCPPDVGAAGTCARKFSL